MIDGVLSSEHEPTPALLEYRKALEPVHLVDGSTINDVRIINRYDFISLENMRCTGKVVGNGFNINLGEIPLPKVGAGQMVALSIPPLPTVEIPEDKHSFLELNFMLAEHKPWAEIGHEVAWMQIQ